MKTQQTPLNTPQPDTKDIQNALDRQKAYTRKLHREIQQVIPNRHHASCRPVDREIVWHCAQCGLNESAADIAVARPRNENADLLAELEQVKSHAQRLADALKNLRQTYGACLDDMRAFGSIKPTNGSNYRKANEETIEALAQWESNNEK